MFGTFPAHEVNSWLVPVFFSILREILRSTMAVPVAVHTLLQGMRVYSRFWGKRTSEDDESLSCKRTKWVYTEMVKLNNKLCTMRLMCFVCMFRAPRASEHRKPKSCFVRDVLHNWPRNGTICCNKYTHTHSLFLSHTHTRTWSDWASLAIGLLWLYTRHITMYFAHFYFRRYKPRSNFGNCWGHNAHSYSSGACVPVCVCVCECVIATH